MRWQKQSKQAGCLQPTTQPHLATGGCAAGGSLITALAAGELLEAPRTRQAFASLYFRRGANSVPCAYRRGPCSAPHSAAWRLDAAQRAAHQHSSHCGEDAQGAPDAQNARQGAPAAHAVRERRADVADAPLQPGQPPLQPAGPRPHLCKSSLQRRHCLHHWCAVVSHALMQRLQDAQLVCARCRTHELSLLTSMAEEPAVPGLGQCTASGECQCLLSVLMISTACNALPCMTSSSCLQIPGHSTVMLGCYTGHGNVSH